MRRAGMQGAGLGEGQREGAHLGSAWRSLERARDGPPDRFEQIHPASWLNLVERFFGEIIRKVIRLGRLAAPCNSPPTSSAFSIATTSNPLAISGLPSPTPSSIKSTALVRRPRSSVHPYLRDITLGALCNPALNPLRRYSEKTSVPGTPWSQSESELDHSSANSRARMSRLLAGAVGPGSFSRS